MLHEKDNSSLKKCLSESIDLRQFPKQYEKYQVLREDQGQGTIYD